MKQVQIASGTTGTVQNLVDLVFRKELAKELAISGIVFPELAEKQIIPIGKTFIQVRTHVFILLSISGDLRLVANPPTGIWQSHSFLQTNSPFPMGTIRASTRSSLNALSSIIFSSSL
jgi:hypothetical protein